MALWQPCAFEISQHMAHTAPCAPPPYTSVHLRTYPYCIAHSIGFAQCALPANRTHSPVLSKFQSTWHTGCHRPSIVFPVFIVFPVGFAPAMRLAQCALPAAGNTLCFLVNAMHMAHGGKPHFSPRVPPFRPCVVERPAARNAASLSYRARTVSRPSGKRYGLNARCHSAAQNIFCAVAAPLCSDSLPRPLRARHRRASPRVLENAQGCSAPLLRPSTLRYAAASPALWNFRSAQPPHSPVPPALRSLRRRRVRTSPYKSVQVRIPLPAPCALHNVLCQPKKIAKKG